MTATVAPETEAPAETSGWTLHQDDPCWAMRDADGNPWDEEWDAHADTREEAQAAIDELRSNCADDSTPEQQVDQDQFSSGMTPVERAKRVAEVVEFRARLASLHVVQLPTPCHTVACAGRDCGDEPEGDEGGHLHFLSSGEFDAGSFDWTEVGGKFYCYDHTAAAREALGVNDD